MVPMDGVLPFGKEMNALLTRRQWVGNRYFHPGTPKRKKVLSSTRTGDVSLREEKKSPVVSNSV